MNYLLLFFYIMMSVTGSLLVKLASIKDSMVLFVVPVMNFKVTLLTLLGMTLYGCSFLLYIVLLTRLNLSFFTPVSIGCVYILMMLSSVVVFHEKMNLVNEIGSVLVFIGILMVVIRG